MAQCVDGGSPSGKRPVLPLVICRPRNQPSPKSSSRSMSSIRSPFARLSSSGLRARKSSEGNAHVSHVPCPSLKSQVSLHAPLRSPLTVARRYSILLIHKIAYHLPPTTTTHLRGLKDTGMAKDKNTVRGHVLTNDEENGAGWHMLGIGWLSQSHNAGFLDVGYRLSAARSTSTAGSRHSVQIRSHECQPCNVATGNDELHRAVICCFPESCAIVHWVDVATVSHSI